jgi:hypothetical protein
LKSRKPWFTAEGGRQALALWQKGKRWNGANTHVRETKWMTGQNDKQIVKLFCSNQNARIEKMNL